MKDVQEKEMTKLVEEKNGANCFKMHADLPSGKVSPASIK